jgi:hypothetical protein
MNRCHRRRGAADYSSASSGVANYPFREFLYKLVPPPPSWSSFNLIHNIRHRKAAVSECLILF